MKTRTIQNYPEAVIQDGHTHTHYRLKKWKDLPEDAEKEQTLPTNIKETHRETPGKKPSENKNTVKKDSRKRLAE